MPGSVSNTYHGYKEDMPRPDVQTLLTQKPSSLDHQNRFFEDNKKRLNKMLVYDYAQEEPQYSDKKKLATKVTVREFIKMPDVDVPVPKGYREAIVHTNSKTGPWKKQTTTQTKRKSTKQVSEVDDQGSFKAGKWQVDMGGVSGDQPQTLAQQVEEKMQKTV